MFNFKNVYIDDWYSIVGKIESQMNLKNVSNDINDYYYNEDTIEKAEVKMQKEVLNNLCKIKKPSMVFGMDLLDQITVTNLNMTDRNIPFMGIYSACASFGSGIIMLSNLIDSRRIKDGVVITSSHNLTAEKQFRFPVEYGAPKPKRSTFTVTGSIGIKCSNKISNIRIVNGTIGNVVNSNIKDVYNMGAVMAPSAVDTLLRHLEITNTSVDDYDLIITGDLGNVGMKIFKELLLNKNIKIKNYVDAGTLIYHNKEYSGASGPTVLPLVLFNNIIYNKKYKKILALATGALHSPLLINQKNPIPAITHAFTLEVIK